MPQRTYQPRKGEGPLPGARARQDVIAALDIGTTKVCVLVAELSEESEVDITGYGVAPSHGMRRGVVVDVEGTVRAICEAVEKAEHMADVRVRSVTLGVAGTHVQSFNNRGVIAIAREDKDITEEDVARALEAARVLTIPPDRDIIHVRPREFIVDGFDGIRDPVGMVGNRLEVEANIVTGSTTSIENILRCVARADLEVEGTVLSGLASGEAVLHPAERELGVVVADIGGGTTDVAIFDRGGLWHAAVIPVGGDHITNDLAVGLRTPLAQAEKVKIQDGVAMVDLAPADEFVEIPDVGGSRTHRVGKRALAEIIQPRVEEIFDLIVKEIKKSGREGMLPGGIVVTGGTALLRGLDEVGQYETGLPVRVGYPQGQAGLADLVRNPGCSCAVGLVHFAAQNLLGKEETGAAEPLSGLFAGIFGKVKNWFKQSY
ncbi:MAG TPA: cell division protein FtsA [Clostridiales bacterium]|nr:cell division protein FtsA [Clostridiales bacterium]